MGHRRAKDRRKRSSTILSIQARINGTNKDNMTGFTQTSSMDILFQQQWSIQSNPQTAQTTITDLRITCARHNEAMLEDANTTDAN